MLDFELIANIVDALRGNDKDLWREILWRTLKHDDPYSTRVPKIQILEVIRDEGIKVSNLMSHLKKKKVAVDEKIIAAFKRLESTHEVGALEIMRMYDGLVMVKFDPHFLGVPYDTYTDDDFGFRAEVAYTKVVEAALKYGLVQPDLVESLYFRLHFFDAHKYKEGTRYYIGCKPIVYADDAPPIIPALDYDRYEGWSIAAREITPETLIDVSSATGQGEHFGSTFVFGMPRQGY